ncbi:MAG: DUF2116 family Zn-ribbon domain-containing protein [Prevotellaceae bacterium]|jgi:predicted nucleic acid-binding Zn ribbon protein|nr:DUF2116 family Zn-ribbon domain-containing protein [Prevotellaceae bacterium]
MGHCKVCGTPLAGRVDKQFCDDACRSGFHNQKNREEDSFLLKVNKVLKKNRKVLAQCSRYQQPVLIQKLLDEGFKPGYCTKVELISKRKGYLYFCYDYGYKTINKKQVEILHEGA